MWQIHLKNVTNTFAIDRGSSRGASWQLSTIPGSLLPTAAITLLLINRHCIALMYNHNLYFPVFSLQHVISRWCNCTTAFCSPQCVGATVLAEGGWSVLGWKGLCQQSNCCYQEIPGTCCCYKVVFVFVFVFLLYVVCFMVFLMISISSEWWKCCFLHFMWDGRFSIITSISCSVCWDWVGGWWT